MFSKLDYKRKLQYMIISVYMKKKEKNDEIGLEEDI